MGKVFTADEFVKKCKWLVNDVPTVYYSGKNWSKRNSKGQVQFDCVLSVKCLLWNFRNDYKINSRGGTVYKANGVADFTCNGGVEKYSTNVSTNFSNLVPGEYLCMKGTKYNHTGIYLGNGKVFECTTGWNTKKCIISDIDSKGTRSYKGVKNLKWTYHGKLIYIDYSNQPKPITPITVWQEAMNKQWNCGLEVDGHYGPKCREQARKHQLTYGCNAPIMVKWLQTRLKELGYELKVDGSFGPDTRNKVKQFQKSKHLNPDGIVGEDTIGALIE